MMIKKKNSPISVSIITIILTMSLLSGAFVYGAASPDFPLEVVVDGKTYRFATHTGSTTDGNWIELGGEGTDITLPELTLRYDGVTEAAYTKTNDVTIDTDGSFVGDSVTYPFDTHPIYSVGDAITVDLRGPDSYSGFDIELRLIEIDDPLDWEDAISDLYNGDNTDFEALIAVADPNVNSVETTTFDVDGDYNFAGVAGGTGDYMLLALDDAATMTIYSATLLEIVEGELSSVIDVDSVDEGDDLDIDMTLTGANTGSHVFGALMIKESAYQATALMSSSGSISSTEVTVNGATVIDGGDTSFSLFAGGFGGFSKDAVLDFMGDAFSNDEWAVAFSTSTDETNYVLSVDTNGLDEADYVVLTAIWDSSGSISTGDRILGIDQDDGVHVEEEAVDRPKWSPPVTEEEPPTQDEFDEQSTEEKVETIEDLDTDDAVDLLEGSSTTDAAQVLDSIDDDKAAEIIEEMDPDKAVEVIETMGSEAAIEILGKTSTEKATEILTKLDADKSGEIVEGLDEALPEIVENSVSTNKTDEIGSVLNSANKEKVGDALLAVTPETGAKVIKSMATQNLNSAAERVEETVKRQIESLDPEQKNAYRQKIKETMENPNLTVDDLVNLFVEIANLPETPSTVAEIFEIIDLGKTIEVVDGMVAKDKEQETVLVFSYLSTEKLTEIYSALSAATRTAIYPYFDTETLGGLPQLGEFSITSLEVSPDSVEPGDTVTVTAVLENIGEETDSTTVTLSVNGVETESEIVTLNVDGSTTLTWEVSKTAEGTYNIDVMGEAASFMVQAPPEPAAFSLSGLQVTPSTIAPGEDVTVSFTVMNTGEESGEYSVDVILDGTTVDTLTGTLDGGDSASLTATVSSEVDGTHNVAVDGLDADFSVEAPPSGFPWIYVIVAIVLIAVGAYVYMQQQKQ